jgi:hypothetical protein
LYSLLFLLLEELHIYTSTPNWFSPRGFYPRSCWPKTHEFIFHVCLVIISCNVRSRL